MTAQDVARDELVDRYEIADGFGVTHKTVAQWVRRFPTEHPLPFPEPVRYVARHPLYAEADVRAWAEATGRAWREQEA